MFSYVVINKQIIDSRIQNSVSSNPPCRYDNGTLETFIGSNNAEDIDVVTSLKVFNSENYYLITLEKKPIENYQISKW